MDNNTFLGFLNNRFQKPDLISHGINITQDTHENYRLNFHGYEIVLNLVNREPHEDPEFDLPDHDWKDFSFDILYCLTDKAKSGYLENFDCYYDDKSTIEFSLTATKLQKAFASSIWIRNIFHFSDSINDISISRMSHEMSFAFFESEKYAEYFNKHLIPYLDNLTFHYDEILDECGDMFEAQSCLLLNFDSLMRSREFSISISFKEVEKQGIINYSDPKVMNECLNKIEQVLYLAAKKEDVSFFLNKKEFFLPTDEHRDESWELDTPIFLKEIDEKVVSYYKAATYTEISSQKFTYYYQVLEYFFLKVSEKIMLAEIQQEISDSNTSIQVKSEAVLNKLLAMKNKNDEVDNLKKVLREYVDDLYVIGLIDKYKLDIHVLNNSNFFKATTTDSIPLTIDKNNGRALPNLAKVIYFIRCLLVHSSDKFDRLECWTPFSENEKIIEPFVPVMKKLAEQIIEGSALAKSRWFEL